MIKAEVRCDIFTCGVWRQRWAQVFGYRCLASCRPHTRFQTKISLSPEADVKGGQYCDASENKNRRMTRMLRMNDQDLEVRSLTAQSDGN